MFDIGSLVRFPLEDRNWILKVVIGWIITLVPIVNLLSVGYLAETMRLGVSRRQGLPEWQDFIGLFALGLTVFAIGLIYLIIPLLVLLAGAGGAIWAAVAGFRLGELLQVGFAGGVAVIGLILVVVVGLVVPFAIARYLELGNFQSAFDVAAILRRMQVVLGEYLVWYLLFFVALVVLGWLALVPLIGWILTGLATFYASLVFANLVGQLYREAEAPQGRGLS